MFDGATANALVVPVPATVVQVAPSGDVAIWLCVPAYSLPLAAASARTTLSPMVCAAQCAPPSVERKMPPPGVPATTRLAVPGIVVSAAIGQPVRPRLLAAQVPPSVVRNIPLGDG